MPYKLELKNALSYSGIVTADVRNPFVIVENEEIAMKAEKTGYFSIVETVEGVPVGYTESSIKKLNTEQQKEVILSMGGDPEETKNEGERIALILKLQEEQGE